MIKKEKTMERIQLPLCDFTMAQKLDLMETLWDDIAREENSFETLHCWHQLLFQ